MTQAERDRLRASEAAKLIIGDRDVVADRPEILITLEHTVSLLLLVLMQMDHAAAARMLKEGLVPGVENRLLRHKNKERR